MKKKPLVSIIIPTRNSEKYLEHCLITIRKQTYKNIEIIISDGLSSDNTLKIAKKYDCIIIKNKDVLAEPGVNLGIKNSKAKYCSIFAIDNYFYDKHAIDKIIHMMERHNVSFVFPKHCSKRNYSIISKYINQFSDPFTHFIKGFATNGRTFKEVFSVYSKCQYGYVFDFKDSSQLPTIALAQGFFFERKLLLNRDNIHDDISPIIALIKQGHKIAFAEKICLFHDTVKDINHFYRKQRWAARNAFLRKKYGVISRIKTLTKKERLLSVIFPFYGILIFPALINSLYRIIFLKEHKLWLFHPILSFVSSVAIWYEFFYSLFDKSKNNISRL